MGMGSQSPGSKGANARLLIDSLDLSNTYNLVLGKDLRA